MAMHKANMINPKTGKRFGWEEEQKLAKELSQLEQDIRLTKRAQKALDAREDLLTFTQFTMPDPAFPNDVDKSVYQAAAFHKAIAHHLEQLERGEFRQLILTLPPRAGKTELATKRFVAWFMGRNPEESVAIATYSDTMAEDYGSDIRWIINSPTYKQAFPKLKLRRGAQAKSNIQTEAGGRTVCVGVGGALTGRGAGLLICDDLVKGAEEARSQTMRDQTWEWFTKVAMTRRMGKKLVVIIMCMTGDTPVLMADGREKMLRDVRPGDMVASYSEGRLVASRVVNHINNGPDSCFEIKMTSGITVKANERHPFLVDRDGVLEWTRLRHLKIGDAIVRVSGTNGRTSRVDEKAASSPPNVKATACPTTIRPDGLKVSDPRLTTLRRGEPYGSSIVTASPSKLTRLWSHTKKVGAQFAKNFREKTFGRIGAESCASITATIPGRSGACCATTAISPLATAELRKGYSQPLDTYAITRDKVSSIKPIGREDVYDIQVEGTENFIANGLVSHNTRWHADDVVGRLTDPENPHFSAEEAAGWKIISIPAIAEEDDILGRAPGEPLWPERFDLAFLKQQQRLDPLGFASLYQQRPSVADGVLFRRETLAFYEPNTLPADLRIYCASDHAVGMNQRNDPTCLLKVGIDRQNNIYILEADWRKMPGDVAVEAMLVMGGGPQKPLLWWAEKGHISKSLGPFLRKRMLESGTYINMVEVTPIGDKEQRAQSIAARVAMGKVYFPKHAVWTERAINEMLAFPNGTHDDFVDTLAMIGLGMESQFGASKPATATKAAEGTFNWLKRNDMAIEAKRRAGQYGGF